VTGTSRLGAGWRNIGAIRWQSPHGSLDRLRLTATPGQRCHH
jgi:hypothetical protein